MSSKDYIWEWINTAGMTSHLGRVFLFLPGIIWALASHLFQLRQFKAFQVMALNMCFVWGIYNKKCLLYWLQGSVQAFFQSVYTVCIFDLKWFAECQQNLGHPQERSCGNVGLDHYVSPSVSPGEFLEASEDKNWEQRIPPGHVEWWHDTKQMFGLMYIGCQCMGRYSKQDLPVLQDFDRYCSVMSSSNIAKYYLLELSCFDVFEQTSCHAMSPCSGRCAPMAWDVPKSTCTKFHGRTKSYTSWYVQTWWNTKNTITISSKSTGYVAPKW